MVRSVDQFWVFIQLPIGYFGSLPIKLNEWNQLICTRVR